MFLLLKLAGNLLLFHLNLFSQGAYAPNIGQILVTLKGFKISRF